MHTFFNFYSVLKMELKQFHREKIVWASLILVSIYFMIGYRYFFMESIRVGQFFQSSGYIGMASILLGFVQGALSASREKRYHFSDTMSSLAKGILMIISKMTAWLCVSSAMIIFIFIELLFLIWFHDSEFLFFWDMILLYITLYWGIPLFSAGLIGYAIETVFPSKRWKMPLLLFILFIASPYNYVLEPFVPSPVLAFLNQGERDLEAAYHGIQGLEVGYTIVIKRIIFCLASMVLISLSVFFAQERKKQK